MPRWTRVVGTGVAFVGPCRVFHILALPDANNDYADVYDGVDTGSGKKFCRVYSTTKTIQHLPLGEGVIFDRGVYVDGKDAAVETTIVFEPLAG